MKLKHREQLQFSSYIMRQNQSRAMNTSILVLVVLRCLSSSFITAEIQFVLANMARGGNLIVGLCNEIFQDPKTAFIFPPFCMKSHINIGP